MALEKFLPIRIMQHFYINAGMDFGDAVSYIYIGECHGFEELFGNWAKWEKEYSRRGYRTISIDDFVRAGGYGKDISNLTRIKRNPDEKALLHAEIYKQICLGRIKPKVDIAKMLREKKLQAGTYELPSTKNASS